MSIFSHSALQEALYDTLTNDIPLIAMITGVYDKVPENTQFPYITIGDIACADWGTKTSTGMECTANIGIFSREGGRQQANQIMERVYALLHNVDMAVDDHQLVMIRFVSSGVMQEADGETYRGIMRFRGLLQKT